MTETAEATEAAEIAETSEPVAPAKKPRRKRARQEVAVAPIPPPATPQAARPLGIIEAVALLEEGIAEANWSKVAESYRSLSGREAPPVQVDARAFLEDLGQMIAHFMGSAPIQAPRSRPGVEVRRELPMGPEPVPSKEYRPQFQYKRLTCCRCGKMEDVHPALVPRRIDAQDDVPQFSCNKCIVNQRKG